METRSNYVMVGAVTVALLAGVLLFIVWLAGLSNKATKCYDIYFAQGVGGLNKGSNVSFSGVPVGQVQKISLLPNRPEFVWVRIEVDEQTPVLQGTSAQIHGVGFTGVSEIQLPARERGRPPIEQTGPAGLPGRSGELGRHQRAAQQRAGADRPDPAADRAADRAAQRQEPEFDLRHSREYRRDHARCCAEHAPEMADTIAEIEDRRRTMPGIAAQQCRGADRQHQPPGHRAGPAGGPEPQQGDRLGPAGGRQSQRR